MRLGNQHNKILRGVLRRGTETVSSSTSQHGTGPGPREANRDKEKSRRKCAGSGVPFRFLNRGVSI